MKFIQILFSTPMVQAIINVTKTQTRRTKGLEKFNIVPDSFINQNEYREICRFWDEEKENDPNPLKTYHILNSIDGHKNQVQCPYGHPGDILLVRETYYAYGWWIKNGKTKSGKQKWKFVDFTVSDNNGLYCYEGCKPSEIITKREANVMGWYKRPSLFMPKAACRIFLKVKSVRVERLQDISEQDAKAEGAQRGIFRDGPNTEKGEFQLELNNHSDYKNGFQFIWQSINGKQSWEANPWVWVIKFDRIELNLIQREIFLNKQHEKRLKKNTTRAKS